MTWYVISCSYLLTNVHDSYKYIHHTYVVYTLLIEVTLICKVIHLKSSETLYQHTHSAVAILYIIEKARDSDSGITNCLQMPLTGAAFLSLEGLEYSGFNAMFLRTRFGYNYF